MSDLERIPKWLKSLPLAPEYHPTETEFADPIAFISRVEREASAFGICKIVPPFPKPSKKFVLSNLTRSLAPNSSPAPSSSSPTRFTTRHQELGDRRVPTHRHRQQVWQSGDFYTFEQFESKSKSFQKSQLSGFKEITPLLVESLFWKAASEKPIYIEYANDVPGSGFAAPEEPFLYRKKRRKLAEPVRSSVEEGTAGWKLSNSPWNLQVIARAPGSLTRFMPDEVPGVTSPMVYIGMLFSWFAWHVEDHELHSLNFLHMGAPKTWYAVAGEHASRLEEIVRVKGYGGDLDRLEAFTMLGEKTTLLSPEMIVKSGVPCCRLVQNPGDFVVTFPRAYHIGFSHGFNCGEAANFATPQWLKVAKEAAVRRAAMNHLPMLSHQQLLYMLTVSFVSRVPRALLSGVRSSRLSDRKREEREILVKKAFLSDMMNENNLLCALIQKGSTSYAVLWEPDLLPNPCTVAQSFNSSLGVQGSAVKDDKGKDITPWKHKDNHSSNDNENPSYELTANPTSISCHNPVEKDKNASHGDDISSVELLEILDAEEDDLPFGLKIDSGTLACVACGILGYPFMAIVQPSEATEELFAATGADSHMRLGKSGYSQIPSCLPNTASQFGPEGTCNILQEQENPNSSCKVSPAQFDHVSSLEGIGTCDGPKLLNDNGMRERMNTKTNPARENVLSKAIVPDTKPFSETHSIHGVPVKTSSNEKTKWTSSHGFNRPRIFCLQHALEVDELLHSKGGAHVLVICHSDNLKIKAYIPSIAEEVGMGINITDVPLENASPSDLNLINISIDNGEHDEHGEDWTSKLGVNLRFSMKLRKQSTSKQERLTLALGRIFSDPVSLSDFSTLKWQSKRSRTPYKVVGISLTKSHIDANMENSNALERYLNANFSPKVKDFQSCRRNTNDMARKHHGFKNVQKEFGSSNGSSVVNIKDDYSTASYSHNLSERVEYDHIKGLFTVPVSSTEDRQMQEGSWFPLKVSRADEVTNSESCERHHPCAIIPVLESSDICQGTNSPVQFPTKCRVDNSKNQESQPHLLELEAANSEVPEIEALDEINSEHEVYNNVESDVDPTSQGAVAYTGGLQDFPMPQKRKSRVSGLVNYLLSAEQSHLPASSNDTAELEVSNSDESNLELNISHSLKLVGQIVSNQSKVDSLGAHQKEIPMVKVSVEEVPKMEDSVNHSSKLVEPVVSNPPTIDRCRIQEKEIPQLGVPIGEEPKMEGRIDPSLRSEKHFVEHPSSVDSCGMQKKLSTAEEPGEDGNDDHSSRSERLPVSNLPMLDAASGMQQEIPDAENNWQMVNNVQLVTQQNAPMVVSSDVQQEISVDGTNTDNKVSILNPVVESSSANSEHITAASVAESSEVQESDKNKELFVEGCNKNQNTVCIHYVRRRRKRKREQMAEDHHKCTGSFICSGREEKHIAEDHQSCDGSFIRGPCEGLRPRTRLVMGAPERVGFLTVERNRAVSSVKRSGKDKLEESYECDIQGCCSKFRRKGVLQLHMQNRCIYRGCRKQFRSHKDLMRHLRVHDDERPLKCPWKGCQMSFKWEWARTEHLRIHTGERPYQCTVAGCELTFRYVSDFSRHRRKTGHYVNQTDG